MPLYLENKSYVEPKQQFVARTSSANENAALKPTYLDTQQNQRNTGKRKAKTKSAIGKYSG